MKLFKKLVIVLMLCTVIVLGLGAYLYWGAMTTNPHGYGRIGEIKPPSGYERVDGKQGSFASYLRSLPLKERGAKVKLYTGGNSNLQTLAYAVVDMPLLSNYEQCADCCIRLRAEYLYSCSKYDKIQFKDVNNNLLKYGGGLSRSAFEKYLCKVYGVASTFSLNRYLPKRKLSNMEAGDLFVFAAQDRPGFRYGHAVMVVDVAVNKAGEKVFLLAEGNTPAREIHVMRNWKNPLLSPWFRVDPDDEDFMLSCFEFTNDELRHW